MSEEKISAYPHNGSNGIVIVCKQCGISMEETDDGYYSPIVYVDDQYDRLCRYCREYNES